MFVVRTYVAAWRWWVILRHHHLGDIWVLFPRLRVRLRRADRPIQFHLMPSAGYLTTFPWHGARQYTPRTISRITRLFGKETSKRLYFPGSLASANFDGPWSGTTLRRSETKPVSTRWSSKAA